MNTAIPARQLRPGDVVLSSVGLPAYTVQTVGEIIDRPTVGWRDGYSEVRLTAKCGTSLVSFLIPADQIVGVA